MCSHTNEIWPCFFYLTEGEDDNDDDKNSDFDNDVSTKTNPTDFSPVCNKSILKYFFDHDNDDNASSLFTVSELIDVSSLF